MARNLRVTQIALAPAGLQQSLAIAKPNELRELDNLVNFRGRWGLRPPITVLATLKDDAGTPANVTQVLGAINFNGAWWVATWSSGQSKVYLHEIDNTAYTETSKTIVWGAGSAISTTPVTAAPMIVLEVMAGGALDTNADDRLYICDYNQDSTNPLGYYSTSDSAMHLEQASLTADGGDATKRNMYPSIVKQFQFHLWASGFLEYTDGTTIVLRDELLRFSRPGLVDDTDLDWTSTQHWHINDWRGVGRRKDKITALVPMGGLMLVGKRRQLYSIEGFDRQNWALSPVSEKVGIVGPYAAATTGDGRAFFWSEKGPMMTNGRQVVDIGEPIRKLVNSAIYDVTTSCVFSPDDGLVYFAVAFEGDDAPQSWLAFDVNREKWCKGAWLIGTTTQLPINYMAGVGVDSLPGPVAAPSNLSATVNSDSQVTLSWTNGDTAIGTTTVIESCSGTGCTSTSEISESPVGAGTATVVDTGLSARTIYRWKVKHVRNGVSSSYTSLTADTKTALAAPTGLYVKGDASGAELHWTNVQTETAGTITIQSRNLSTGGPWTQIANPTNNGTSSQSYTDTSCTCGDTYEYRVKATETGWTDSDWSNTVTNVCCSSPPALTSVTHDWTPPVTCPGPDEPDVTISYTATGVESGDTVKIYWSAVAGACPQTASFSLVYTGPLKTHGSVSFLSGWKKGGTQYCGQAKVEVYESGNSVAADTATSTAAVDNINTTPCQA